MIIIQCIGGLGNQMFQYALYKNFKKLNIETSLDISDFNKYSLHNGYELEKIFNLNIDYCPEILLKKFKVKRNQYIKRLVRKINKDLISHKIVEPYIFNSNIFQMHNAYLEGYWQNMKYINSVSKELRNDFKFDIDNLDELNKKNLYKIKSDNKSVSIHIRRGDYINNSTNYEIYGGICEEEYYTNAINLLETELENPNFYVFSNDIEWVKNNLHIKNVTYFDYNKNENSYKDLILMSSCKHNIIANSTFSWWGAWLNEYEDKIVIMPKKWTRKHDNPLSYDGCRLI